MKFLMYCNSIQADEGASSKDPGDQQQSDKWHPLVPHSHKAAQCAGVLGSDSTLQP